MLNKLGSFWPNFLLNRKFPSIEEDKPKQEYQYEQPSWEYTLAVINER